jgi:hypothetical protein
VAQLQSLLTGRVEPEQFVESVETDYTAAQ